MPAHSKGPKDRGPWENYPRVSSFTRWPVGTQEGQVWLLLKLSEERGCCTTSLRKPRTTGVPKRKPRGERVWMAEARMDGTPERSWLAACRNALGSAALLPTSHPTLHFTQCRMQLLYSFLHWLGVWHSEWNMGDPWGFASGEGRGKGLSSSSATQPLTICTALCVSTLCTSTYSWLHWEQVLFSASHS